MNHFSALLLGSFLTPSLLGSTLLEIDFSHLTPGSTISDGDRIEDISGNGHHGFWGDASGTYSVVSTGVSTALDTSSTTRGHIFHRDGLTAIPAAWDGPTTSITPYFVLNGGNSYTFEAVVKWNGATSATNGLMGQTGSAEFWLRESGGALQYTFDDGSNVVALTDGTIDISAAKADGQFHSIAVVYDAVTNGGEIRSYLDGALLHTNPEALIGTLGNMTSGTVDFRTGAFNTTDPSAFNGIQDHYRISDAPLAPAQMLTSPPPTVTPTASNVVIDGFNAEGSTLTGTYNYNDAQGDLEGTSTYKWFRSTDAIFDVGDTEIAGAQLTTYTLQAADVGSFIFFEVTPEATTGPTPGLAVQSNATAQINLPGPFPESAPFISGVGYHTYRIPAMVRANDGALLAFCEGRASTSDTGDIDIVLKRSTDNGATWGALIIAQSEGTLSIGNPAPVVDRTTGHIHMLFCRENETVFHTVSTDGGLTWSVRTEITADVKLPTWGWYATGPCHGVQLTRGTQAGRLVIPANHAIGTGNQDTANKGAQMLYSDDNGATWHMDTYFETTFSGAAPNETTLVELNTPGTAGGSHIYINSRDYDATPGNRSEAWSGDGGSSYSVPYNGNPHFVTPIVQGSLSRFGAIDEGDAVNRIIFSCPNGGSRTNGALWVSYDEAVTWSQPKPLFPANPGDYAYSDMAVTASDDLGVLYETNNYGAIKFIRVSEAWIDAPPPPVSAPQSSLWLFEEKAIGNTVDLTPGAILDSHPAGNALHLTTDSATLAYAAGAEATTTALAFDDSGGLSIADGTSAQAFDYGPDDNVTFEARFKIPTTGASLPGAIIAKNQASGGEWWIRVESSGILRFLWDDGGSELIVASTSIVDDDTWHHVAAVRDADNNELRIYIDGTLEGTTPDTTTGNIANGVPFVIGAFANTASRNLVGSLDWVSVTTAALAPGGFVSDRLTADTDLDAIPDSEEMLLTGNLTSLGSGDFDNNGQPDLLEIALGSNPTLPNEFGAVGGDGPENPNRVFAYTRRHDIPWLLFSEEFSTDLTQWGGLPAPLAGSTNTLDPSLEEVIFTAPLGTLPPELFLRVGVSAVFP